MNQFRKIDVHCHTTKRLLSHTAHPDASLKAIEAEMEKYNIKHTLLLATYFPRKGTGISNFRMNNWIEEATYHPEPIISVPNQFPEPFFMFGSLDFEYYFKQGFNELEEMAERKLIRGVKIYAGYQKLSLHLLEKEILPLCVRHNLPIMFHTGDCTGMGGAYADARNFIDLIEKFNSVSFLFSHMCNPHIFVIIDLIKQYKNVYTDMSGLIHSTSDRHEIPDCITNVRRIYDECGINQFMFGTDFPVQTHADSIMIAEKSLHNYASEEDLKKFYWDTAARILKVSQNV